MGTSELSQHSHIKWPNQVKTMQDVCLDRSAPGVVHHLSLLVSKFTGVCPTQLCHCLMRSMHTAAASLCSCGAFPLHHSRCSQAQLASSHTCRAPLKACAQPIQGLISGRSARMAPVIPWQRRCFAPIIYAQAQHSAVAMSVRAWFLHSSGLDSLCHIVLTVKLHASRHCSMSFVLVPSSAGAFSAGCACSAGCCASVAGCSSCLHRHT